MTTENHIALGKVLLEAVVRYSAWTR